MRRKLLIVSVLAAVTLGLTSCGSKPADSAESVEAVQNADETEAVTSEEIVQQSETTAEETSTEVATKERASDVQDNGEVTWYMDSEGLKSDALGIIIRKDNDDEQVLGLSESFLFDDHDSILVCCDYYDGGIDTYISEYPIGYGPYLGLHYISYYLGYYDMQKASIGNYEYAYILEDDSAFVVFIGNGIAVSLLMHLDADETVESCMNWLWNEEQRIGLCNKFERDCMAYITNDGIYCPALGMQFIAEHEINKEAVCGRESSQGEMYESIKFEHSSDGIPGSVQVEDVQDAQDAVEKCVKYAVEETGIDDSVMAGETETRNFGKYTYFGKGYTWTNEYSFGDGTKYFCSDDINWSIEFSYRKDNENYIDCIESLK